MEVTDLGRFLDAVRLTVEHWTPADADWYPSPWFRGHGDERWVLEPGWYRVPPPDPGLGEDWYNERTLLLEFSFRAPRYLTSVPASDWEWLFVMQHYGLPTRLLDWSESALIALYFAVRDHSGDGDACVWMLNPWWLNKQSLGEYEIPHALDARVADWAPRAHQAPLSGHLPVAIKPVQTSARIAAQKGFFTIHGTERGALERLAHSRADDGPGLRKITIPKGRVADLRRDLTVAGITETTIFQELDGLCRELKANFFTA